jgi:hypothetical protein
MFGYYLFHHNGIGCAYKASHVFTRRFFSTEYGTGFGSGLGFSAQDGNGYGVGEVYALAYGDGKGSGFGNSFGNGFTQGRRFTVDHLMFTEILSARILYTTGEHT